MRNLFIILMGLIVGIACSNKDYEPVWVGEAKVPSDGNNGGGGGSTGVVDSYWWPEQKAPTKIVWLRDINVNTGVALSFDIIDNHRLAQSISGLAAQSVNAGSGDEMVWIDISGNERYTKWFADTKTRLGIGADDITTIETDGAETQTSLWRAVKHFKEKGVIKGYVLYRRDVSMGANGATGYYDNRAGTNISVNAATVIAAIKGGVLISEEQEAKAIEAGLTKLDDATEKTSAQVWAEYKGQVNKDVIFTIDPKVAHNRDMAIAHKGMVCFGIGEDSENAMKEMNSISPVIGWNKGGEDAHTELVSKYGLFNTASNWTNNMSLMSAGSKEYAKSPTMLRRSDPKHINFGETGKTYHAFVMSDGDNIAWMTNDFHTPIFLTNPDLATIPMTWTGAVGNTSMASPAAWSAIANTMPQSNSFIEFGGGYCYPDWFDKLGEKEETFRKFARQSNENMKKANVTMFGYITRNDVNSDIMQKINQILVDEIENLTGIFAVQYAPYNNGEGVVHWYTNKKDIHVPVISPKYLLWNPNDIDAGNNHNRAGNPEMVAGYVNADVTKHTITMVHAWSKYPELGTDAAKQNQGVYAVANCVEQLNANVKVVSFEELLWRVRMEAKPEQTKQVLGIE